MTGFIYRHLQLADSRCISRVYKAIVLPILNYSAVVWDPYHLTLVSKLERVQEFAAKVTTKQWTKHGSICVAELNWPTLKDRRKLAKLCLCRRILRGESLIPPSAFTPHPSSSVRHVNSMPLFLPRVRTDYNRGSFFVSVVRAWNDLPDYLVKSNSFTAFKRSIKNLLLT